MQKVNFYTKLNCPLCDQAYIMLMDVAFDIPLEIDIRDITDARNSLELEYGSRIPVIAARDIDTELDWPFTIEDVRAYLSR